MYIRGIRSCVIAQNFINLSMIGIYKITSPSGRVYIGQSINIERRFYNYRRLECKEQPILLRSLKKYGVDNHTFEVLIECEPSQLNDLERYYQDLYNVIESGLNCMLVKSSDRSGAHSKETKEKLKEARKHRVFSEETCRKISESHKGKKFSDEHKAKLSKVRKGMFAGDKNPNYGKVGAMTGKKGILSPTFGRKISDEERAHRSKIFSRGGNPQSKKLIDTETKQVFNCVRDAAEYVGCSYGHLRQVMSGARPNKTNLIYL